MYGIEYSAFASLIQDEDLDSPNTNKIIDNQSNLNTSSSDVTFLKSISQSPKTDSLLHKLQTLTECPDYLKPNLYIKSTHCETPKKSLFKNQYTDDFILLSEFSEIEGPKPLLTIPTDGATGFNKNEYSLHLMCVDFHSHTHHQNQHEKKFNFTKDTSIINYWDSNAQVNACVRHFTLYDIEARGFVRPFCMAYISYDQKSVEFFEQINEKFSQVTDLFRKSNLIQFKNELENKCTDLNYTREIFLKFHQADQENRLKIQEEFDLDEKTISRLTSACSSDKSINTQLRTIENLLNETKGVLEVTLDELRSKSWFKTKLSMNNSINFTNKTRSLTYPLSTDENLTINIDNYKNQELYKPSLCHQALTGSYTLSINTELNLKRDKQKIMKRLHQLCPDTARLAINQLRLTQRYFSTPYYLLKYKKLTSNKLSLKKNLFWSITAGDCFIADFSLDSIDQNKNDTTILNDLNKNKTEFFSPKTERTIYLDAKSSQQQIENTLKNYSWSNLESFLDLNDEQSDEQDDSLSVNDFYTNQEILYDDSDEDNSKKELNEYDFANSLVALDNKYSSTNSLAVSLSSSSIGLFYKALNSLRYQSCLTDKLVQFQEFNFEENFKNLIHNFPLIFPHVLYSILKGRPVICVTRYCSKLSQIQSILDCLSNFIPNSFYCVNSLLTKSTPKFTSSPHHLNLASSDKPKLKILHERKPIRLNDLKYCKLFGLSLMIKDTSCNLETHKHYEKEDIEDLLLTYIPITIRNYVSILDLDVQTYSGPKYTGTYLNNLINKCKYFSNDSVIYLFLISNVFNFYSKLAFVYNNSILFENESQSFMESSKLSIEDKNSITSLSRKEKLVKFFSKIKEIGKSKNEIEIDRFRNYVNYVSTQATSYNFDQCDYKIVSYFVTSLKIKQIYLYNLALHKKELKEMNKIKKSAQNGDSIPLIQLSTLANTTSNAIETSNKLNSCNNSLAHSADIQIPLLVEYEEIHFFNGSKK
ncbi:unnamed protein product [Brachionus calyciflorus]|uniref:UDENN FLCN/SMCR8-type domain-containing protein n=1 Tax=Brachionus calyciflorus TaxID=104777 RepID=A0A814DF78_9BILA|nr:unnamed protein product [Brachionus calyciflorus]